MKKERVGHKRTSTKDSYTKISFPIEPFLKDVLSKKLIYTLAKRYENVVESIIYDAESFLNENLNTLSYQGKKHMNNLLRQGERAKKLSKTLLYLSGVGGETSIQNLNERIVHFEEVTRTLFGEDVEIVYALADEIPYTNVKGGIIEEFIMRVAMLASTFLTNKSRVLIESGRQPDDKNNFNPFMLIRISDTNPPSNQLVRILNKREYGYANLLKGIFGEDGKLSIYSEKTSIVIKYLLNYIDRTVSLSEWRGAPLPYGKGTIIIVEEENALREAIKVTLEKVGYNVLLAKSLFSAEKLLNMIGTTQDLLISDIIFSDGNGIDFAKKNSEMSSSPILFLSSLFPNEVPHLKDLEGIKYDFLQKPFNRFELITKVRKLIEGG